MVIKLNEYSSTIINYEYYVALKHNVLYRE